MQRVFSVSARVGLLWALVFWGGQGPLWAGEEAGASPAKEGSPAALVPRLIQFSGALRDRLGNPLTGVQGVTFALYEDAPGSAPLWLET